MKTKKLFLIAVVLLSSVCAFAQSGNSEPSKGDVNGDGVVDVADIVAVIQIMKDGGGTVTVGGYFYLGTTQPTATNYKTLPGVVSTYTSIDEAIGATATVAAGETLYMLCPTTWMTERSVALENENGKTIYFSEDVDAVTISGYTIYKTQVFDTSSTATLKTNYYWYIGSTDPTTMSSISPIVDWYAMVDDTNYSPGWRLIGTTLPTYSSSNMLWNGVTNNISFGVRTEYYIALPNNTLQLWNGLGISEMNGCTSLGTKTINNVTYYIYKRNVKAKAFGFNIY